MFENVFKYSDTGRIDGGECLATEHLAAAQTSLKVPKSLDGVKPINRFYLLSC